MKYLLAPLQLIPCALAGIAGGYGLAHLDEPLGIILAVIAAIFLLSIPVTVVGMRLRRGSRFQVGLGVFQPYDHPWRELPRADAESQWRDIVGLSALRLETAWGCKTCPMVRFVIRSLDGRRAHLYMNNPDKPWVRWVAGVYLGFARDPRPEFIEVAPRPAARGIGAESSS